MKLLASDFDNTLYFNETPAFHPEDLAAIHRFQAAGNLFGICTGRNLTAITDATAGLIDFDFFILNNGSVILDRTQKVCYQEDIPTELAIKVMHHFDHLASFAMVDQGIYQYHFDHAWPGSGVRLIEDLHEIRESGVHNFSFHLDSVEETRRITNEINQLGLPITAFQNVIDIDVVAQGNSKGRALKLVQQQYQIADSDLACIGDSYNDLPMLTASDQSFTFNDSPTSVRQAATYTVTSLAQAVAELLRQQNDQAVGQ